MVAALLKTPALNEESEELPKQEEDLAKRQVVGTMDSMLVFNEALTQCQRSLKISGVVYSDDKLADVNQRADVQQAVLERQFLRHDLKRMEREREAQLNNMKQHRDNLAELAKRKEQRDKGARTIKPLTSQEIQMVQNGQISMTKAESILADMDAKIAEAKAKLEA